MPARGPAAPDAADKAGGIATAGRPAVSDAQVRELNAKAEEIGKAGGTPLAVAKDGRLLGVIYLKAGQESNENLQYSNRIPFLPTLLPTS